MPVSSVFLRLTMIASLSVLAVMPPGKATATAQSPEFYDDARVANFAAAERMDGDHLPVTLSFWSGPQGKAIFYNPGDGSGAVQLHRLGRTADGKGLRVRAPDGSTWIVVPSSGVLHLRDNRSTRPRVFLWQYQGPIDGRGTACLPCVDEKEALSFVTREFELDTPRSQASESDPKAMPAAAQEP